jgi:anti-sigma regulatory factor (Ser/Thr protein kinase)
MLSSETGQQAFRHEALFYRDDREFLDETVPLVRDAVGNGAPVLVAVPKARSERLRVALGEDAADVGFADMEELGRNPGRIISAWRDFVGRHAGAGSPPLGIGEPAWPGRSRAELIECDRHESLLNLAFDTGRLWRLVCPYDASGLDAAVLDAARRNHPHVCEGGVTSSSGGYDRGRHFGVPPLPEPASEPATLRFAHNQLGIVRDFVTREAARAGIAGQRLADLVLAIDELATNTLRYAAGHGTLRTWQEDGSLLCEVADGGHIADPLAGRGLPPPEELGGRGLWLVNQLCDLVQVRAAPGGSVVRVHMRAAA